MFITHKRWAHKDSCQESDIISLVSQSIAPAYAQLNGYIGIGLQRIEGTRAYLTTQYWQSRAARDAAVSSEPYAGWMSAYLPTLEKWDAMMALEAEWETLEILDLPCSDPH